MTTETPKRAPNLARLLDRLGYTVEAGWLDAGDFHRSSTHRLALEQAMREMAVVGAFCLKRRVGLIETVATPLVYVASAANKGRIKEIHRKVWSQGLAPFLIVFTSDHLAICPGFSYSDQDWDGHVRWFTWADVDALPPSHAELGGLGDRLNDLLDLCALRLRTSLFWRDHAIDVTGRVDRRLLDNLDALSSVLIRGLGVSGPISPVAANGLIGRFLYVYFLVDRGIIDQKWVEARKHKSINLVVADVDWPASATWSFFDDLDSIFNGSIFPLDKRARAEINASHINLVRLVMKHGAQPDPTGAVQLSFLDIYLGALRTETLSSVYEQFLENIRAGERRRVGAFYTPPFLVDFMLDRLEEVCQLRDGVTVLDPAAGSGVFLVGAYRRLIEQTRDVNGTRDVDLDELRGLLSRNVFGIERNLDACHVAAFSLYLTMLDYVDPRDLTRVAAGKAAKKLFPELVGRNIFAADFFADRVHLEGLPRRVQCVVGNPPWQTLEKLGSTAAIKWRQDHSENAPIGMNQAAELFTWKALREYLAEDGILAFLLPAKSFINPTSWAFRRRLASDFTVIGAANFAHLRYRLFASARQAVVATFVRNRRSSAQDRTWTYSPLSVAQPMARKAWPWTILLDRSEVQIFRHDHVTRDPRGWFEAFMLRPVDRQIKRLLEDRAEDGKIALLEGLCLAVGAAIRRGGNALETGVERRFLLDAPGEPALEDDSSYQRDGRLFEWQAAYDIELPSEQVARLTAPYRLRFGGNALLIPRNFTNIRFVDHPIGYTSSTLGIFFEKTKVSDREKKFLRAISAFLNSGVALYLVATTGRRWLMDRRNIEPGDLAALPVPFTGIEDTRVDEVLARDGPDLDRHLLSMLGLSGDFASAIQEFLNFRMGFQDGDVPEQALSKPRHSAIVKYVEVFTNNLNGLIGRSNAFSVASHVDEKAGVCAVAARFRESGEKPSKVTEGVAALLCRAATEAYEKSSANSFSDSLNALYEPSHSAVTFVKPLEFFRWTVDSAFADSRQAMNAFVAAPA